MPPISAILSFLKVGVPIILVVGVGLYINSLRNNVEDLTNHRDQLIGELAQTINAAQEQTAENVKLRDDIDRANTAKSIADEKRVANEQASLERIDEILQTFAKTEEAIAKSVFTTGDSFNAWIVDWMRRVETLTPNGGNNQDGKTINLASLSPTETTTGDRAIMIAVNSTYAAQLQEQCDDSRMGADGLIDEQAEGNPDFCRWYIVGFPQQRVPEFRIYMEKLYLYMQALQQWGQYHKDATQHFIGATDE